MILRRIILVRHGETEGASSVRFHGRSDVALSAEGEQQLRLAAASLRRQPVGLVVASPLCRSWHGAFIVGRGAPVRLFTGFREVDFGRWEGLTLEEIRASDPVLCEDWRSQKPGFRYPDGESVEGFRERVGGALGQLLAAPSHSALAVLHKGVIREIVRRLVGEPPEQPHPELGEVMSVTRGPRGWKLAPHPVAL